MRTELRRLHRLNKGDRIACNTVNGNVELQTIIEPHGYMGRECVLIEHFDGTRCRRHMEPHSYVRLVVLEKMDKPPESTVSVIDHRALALSYAALLDGVRGVIPLLRGSSNHATQAAHGHLIKALLEANEETENE